MRTVNKRISAEKIALTAMMTALVIVFQLLATLFPLIFGPFHSAIGLVPLAIGAMLCGPFAGAWLGFVFSLVVLFSGGATFFMNFSIPGTIITVITKTTVCGFVCGALYKTLGEKYNIAGAVISAISCPVVNTGFFLLGSGIFFMPYVEEIAQSSGATTVGFSVFIAMAFANFIFELGLCTVLSPVMVRILKIRKKTKI